MLHLVVPTHCVWHSFTERDGVDESKLDVCQYRGRYSEQLATGTGNDKEIKNVDGPLGLCLTTAALIQQQEMFLEQHAA
jgi:hypothetical protein